MMYEMKVNVKTDDKGVYKLAINGCQIQSNRKATIGQVTGTF